MMERRDELAERHLVVRAVAQQVHNIMRKMFRSRYLIRSLICSQHTKYFKNYFLRRNKWVPADSFGNFGGGLDSQSRE